MEITSGDLLSLEIERMRATGSYRDPATGELITPLLANSYQETFSYSPEMHMIVTLPTRWLAVAVRAQVMTDYCQN